MPNILQTFQTDQKRREEFKQIREARDIIRSTPAKYSRIQNLPRIKDVCPIESKFLRRFGVCMIDTDDLF